MQEPAFKLHLSNNMMIGDAIIFTWKGLGAAAPSPQTQDLTRTPVPKSLLHEMMGQKLEK